MLAVRWLLSASFGGSSCRQARLTRQSLLVLHHGSHQWSHPPPRVRARRCLCPRCRCTLHVWPDGSRCGDDGGTDKDVV